MAKPLLLPGITLLVALAIPTVALAQPAAPPPAAPATPSNPNCPPGSWFCADTAQQPAAAAGQPVQQLQPLPGTQAQGQPASPYTQQPPPPVVVYQPPPPVVVYQPTREAPPPPVYYYHPRDVFPRRSEWGLNLHAEGAIFGGGASHSAGMGGVGLGLRYKPIPAFGIETDLDFDAGRDYYGYRRNETAFTVNGLLFLNPRSKAQVYLLAGFGWAAAHAVDDTLGYDRASYNYGYFGGQAGLGLEFRVAKHLALNVDFRGFLRGRIDDNAQYQPEYVDPTTGRTTNTSAGAIVNGGMTFYF
jgi:hypothetical protein